MVVLVVLIVSVVIAAIFGILLVATLGMPVTFAAIISTLGIGVATAIVRFWPNRKD